MVKDTSALKKWESMLLSSLQTGATADRILSLDFLSHQNSFELEFARSIIPHILENVLHADTQVRYFARKARNHFYDCYPEIDSGSVESKPFKLELKEGETLTAQQILLHKLRLGSRYVVFESIERLTDSNDPSLATPLLEFLEQEKDEYKISFLVKRLWKIDDPRILPKLQEYLDHEDPRIVANTLEALCTYDSPDLAEKLTDFATSSDNRIRANALLGLFKYDPELTEKHISEMVRSNNIALQDSAVFLLQKLRPSNLGELLEIVQHSRFATVRLRSLDIAPPTSEELAAAAEGRRLEPEEENPNRDLMIMAFMLIIGVILLIIADNGSKHLLSFLFLGIAAVSVMMPDQARTSIKKIALSIGFISSLAWGNTRLMVLPALMGLWITICNCNPKEKKVDINGEPIDETSSVMFAWFFAVGAIIITQIIQGNLAYELSYAASLLSDRVNVSQDIIDLVSRQGSFEISLFIFVSGLTIALLKFNSWFPKKDPKSKPAKRMFIAAMVCLFIITVMNFAHVFGVSLQLKLTGMKDFSAVVKYIIEQK